MTILASNTDAQKEDEQITKYTNELMACQNYWQRRSKMLMLKNSGLPEKKIKLLEFDLNLSFWDVNGVVETVSELFKKYPNDEEIMNRLKKFMESLFEASNKSFVNDVISNIQPQILLDIFFHVYPNKKSSTGTLSKRFFESYEKARESFIQEDPEVVQKAGGLTPFDLLLLHLAKSFADANFGDLEMKQVEQIYHVMISCCVADSEKRLPESFYKAGIDISSPIHPAQDWNACVIALNALFRKREVLIPALANLKASGQSLTMQNLCEAIFSESFDLLGFPEILRLLLSYAYSRSLAYLSEEILVRIPAHMYNVSYDSMTHIWPHFIKPQKTYDSCITSVKANAGSELAECLEISRKVLESSASNVEIFIKFLESFQFERVYSLMGYSLLVAGQYSIAVDFLKSTLKPGVLPRDYLILTVQLIQAQLAVRDYFATYDLIMILLEEVADKYIGSKGFVPIIPSDEDSYILISEKSLLNYVFLMLFHVFWCAYVKLDIEDTRDFFFDSLLMIMQAIWDFQGYALFPYLIKHANKKKSIFFPDMDKYVTNMAIISHFTTMYNVKFCVFPDKKEHFSSAQLMEWFKTVKFSKEHPIALLMKYLKVFKDIFPQLLNQLKVKI